MAENPRSELLTLLDRACAHHGLSNGALSNYITEALLDTTAGRDLVLALADEVIAYREGATADQCSHDWRIGAHEIGQHGYPFKQHQYCEKCDLSRTVLTDEPKDARTDQLWPHPTD